MSLRRRMVLLTAAAVAFAVALSALACYLAVQSSMRDRLDHQLQQQVTPILLQAHGHGGRQADGQTPLVGSPGAHGYPAVSHLGPTRSDIHLPQPSLQAQGDVALISSSGAIHTRPGDHTRFTVSAHELAVARGHAAAYFSDGKADGAPVRIYVAQAGHGTAVIAIQTLTDLDSTLHDLAEILIAIALSGVALAVLLGLFVARTAAAPVHVLRRATEHVGSTGDLSARISVPGNDDLGRLGESFNSMLSALEQSQRAQRQLVADASHELRTPVATIRTNLEVLARNPDLPLQERLPLLRDLIGESAELGTLVEDLLESAREEDDAEALQPVPLDVLVSSELERWSRRHPSVKLLSCLQSATILGRESRLRRALANMLDNAIKWSPPHTPIEVTLKDATLTVRDHGPGFAEQDIPHVFDRFYRAPSARSVPGSGLGLSIVQKVAEEHGASVLAQNARDGGALVALRFARGASGVLSQ